MHVCKCENQVHTVKCSRPFSKRGAYTASDNAPARNRVWPRETSYLYSHNLQGEFAKICRANCSALVDSDKNDGFKERTN